MPLQVGLTKRNHGVLLSFFIVYLLAIHHLFALPIPNLPATWQQRPGMAQGVAPSLQQPRLTPRPAIGQPNAFNASPQGVPATWSTATSLQMNRNNGRVQAVTANWNAANAMQPVQNNGAAQAVAAN